MPDDGSPLSTLRTLCLALPQAEEKEAWGDPTFRIRGKIFAQYKTGSGIPTVWVKAPDGAQEVLVGADPGRFFRPPYVGHKGWVGIKLTDGPDWEEIRDLLARSHRMVAPKAMAKQWME
jgi:hypothetical protein